MDVRTRRYRFKFSIGGICDVAVGTALVWSPVPLARLLVGEASAAGGSNKTFLVFLCSKFEEIYPPEVAEFVYITDDTYTKKQVLRMEHLVLKVLSFDLAAPTINQFLSQYFLHYAVNKRVESLAMVRGPPPPGAGGWLCKPVRSTPGWLWVEQRGGWRPRLCGAFRNKSEVTS